VVPSHLPEEPLPGEEAAAHVLRLAREKAAAVAALLPGRVVLGADTAVVLDGAILGKPRDDGHALLMLRGLQGRTHQVLTGYAVLRGGVSLGEGIEESRVTMRPVDDDGLLAYLAAGEHRDKAGAYAAQGRGGEIVASIQGSYTNVVGLPMGPVAAVLRRLGYPVADTGPDRWSGPGSPW
jgi:septum formation protein